MIEGNPIAHKEVCSRPESSKFKGDVTYTETQLRDFGFVVEGAFRKIKNIIVVEDGVSSHHQVVSEVRIYPGGNAETLLHPTHPHLIQRISDAVVQPIEST
ncbi:MAG: hypothetical protein RLZZ455_774 [Candidatus Parcubacteria bacterium]|jgi:hypothetical protein